MELFFYGAYLLLCLFYFIFFLNFDFRFFFACISFFSCLAYSIGIQVLMQDSSNEKALFRKGSALAKANQYEQAIAILKKCSRKICIQFLSSLNI